MNSSAPILDDIKRMSFQRMEVRGGEVAVVRALQLQLRLPSNKAATGRDRELHVVSKASHPLVGLWST